MLRIVQCTRTCAHLPSHGIHAYTLYRWWWDAPHDMHIRVQANMLVCTVQSAVHDGFEFAFDFLFLLLLWSSHPFFFSLLCAIYRDRPASLLTSAMYLSNSFRKFNEPQFIHIYHIIYTWKYRWSNRIEYNILWIIIEAHRFTICIRLVDSRFCLHGRREVSTVARL